MLIWDVVKVKLNEFNEDTRVKIPLQFIFYG